MPRGRTLLVTGGAGFVGSHLIRRLLHEETEATVVSVDNYSTGNPANHVNSERVRYVNANASDIRGVWAEHGFGAPSVVYHLGEYARIVQSLKEFDKTWEYNMRGTKEIITFCADHDARLVYGGSSSKFGNNGADEHLNPYAWTKAKNVELIKNYADWYGLDYVCTYFYNVYGPGHLRTGDYATVIGIFEDQWLRQMPLTVVSPGTQTRDFTHVADIVEGLLLCAEHGEGDGYMLGTGREWSIIEVAEMFGGTYEMVPALMGERVRGRADPSKAMGLGWKPTRSLDQYVAEFLGANQR